MTRRSRGYSEKVKGPAVLACGLLALAGVVGGGCTRGRERDTPPAGGGASDPSRKSSPSPPFSSLSFEEALARARAENKLVLVNVYADWCGWCMKMDRDVFTDARVQTALLQVVPIRVNAEKGGGRRVAERYRVMGLPTFLLVNADGDVVRRFEGYRSADAFLRALGPVSGSRT